MKKYLFIGAALFMFSVFWAAPSVAAAKISLDIKLKNSYKVGEKIAGDYVFKYSGKPVDGLILYTESKEGFATKLYSIEKGKLDKIDFSTDKSGRLKEPLTAILAYDIPTGGRSISAGYESFLKEGIYTYSVTVYSCDAIKKKINKDCKSIFVLPNEKDVAKLSKVKPLITKSKTTTVKNVGPQTSSTTVAKGENSGVKQVRCTGQVNLNEIGGKNLIIENANSSSTIGNGGAFNLFVSTEGSQISLVEDGDDVRGMMITTGSCGAGLKIDATSTAVASIFISPGIMVSKPADAKMALDKIESYSCFKGLSDFLKSNLPTKAFNEIVKMPDYQKMASDCVMKIFQDKK